MGKQSIVRSPAEILRDQLANIRGEREEGLREGIQKGIEEGVQIAIKKC
ncbi:hypothetical protein P9214_07095 [Heyndrickxia coagulans]|nr:hypothetical protein [Heyndrickxia coagulans]MEC5269771.1 hypothetical protein [Heyndrickxia coagulans]MED4405666.1 hypothetical protein [Heyndrickxia coagulans]UZH05366.1 hypothetical protein ONG97_10505 [Heyndrickxia coagulans]